MNSATTTGSSLLVDDTLLKPGSAVAAILLDQSGRYLLQLRDRKPGIFFPDYWGCFGGGVDPDDADDAQALRRELHEELGLELAPADFVYFTRYTFDITFCGGGVIYRTFYETRLSAEQVSGIHLAEGQKFGAFSDQDVVGPMRLTPYDAFALWMHVNRTRLKMQPDCPVIGDGNNRN